MTGKILDTFEAEVVKLLAQFIIEIETETIPLRKHNIEMKREGVRKLIDNMGLNYNTLMLKAYEMKRGMK